MSMAIGSQTNRRLRVLWILIFWVLIGGGAYVFGVLNMTGQKVENSLLTASTFNTDPPAPLSLVSPFTIAVALVGLGLVALWVHGIARAATVVLVPGITIVASQLLKAEVLGRPDFLTLGAENSFPSGHMTVFAAVVAAAVFALPRPVQAIAALAGAGLLAVVSWQLLAYGWHRPSDVLGALALVSAGFAAITLVGRVTPSRGVWLIRTVSLGLAGAGWIMIAISLVLAVIAGGSGASSTMLAAGQFGSIAVSLLASHSLLRLAALSYSPKGS